MKRNKIKKDNFQKLQNTILKISIWGGVGKSDIPHAGDGKQRALDAGGSSSE